MVSRVIPVDPFDLVIFGGTGDLARRKILPGLFRRFCAGQMPTDARIIGAARGNIGQQLDKFTFAVLGSSHSAEWVQQRLRQLGLKSRVVTANNTAEGIHMVSTGQADAFFDDRMVLLNYVAQDTDGEKLIVPERLFEETPAALALSRNDEDFRLLVDRSISSLLNSPQGEALYQRHFGEPSEQTRLLFHLYPQP